MVKKVELRSFDGEDPVGWITCAETYLERYIGGGEDPMAKMSIEGATIQLFNLLRETNDELTWLKLNQALMERYDGRHCDKIIYTNWEFGCIKGFRKF